MNQANPKTPQPPANRPAERSLWWLWSVLLVALVALAYWPTLNNGFVSDDVILVGGTAKLSSLSGLGDIWFKLRATPQYWPLTHSVQWVEYQFWELDPRGYHAVNMAVHAIVALLLWRLLARLAVPGAWLAAAIFAVHPVQVESVAWASELKNLLSAALALGSLLCYFRFSPPEEAGPAPADTSRPAAWGYYALSLALYLAAILSKTVGVSTPAVMLVIYWWKRGRLDWLEAARLIPFFAVGIPMVCVTIWLESSETGAVGPEWDFTPVERVLIAGRAAWFYAVKLAWPHPLAFNYPRWQIDAHAGWQYLFPAAALALLVVLGLLQKRIGRGPLAAALIFGGVLLPVLGFFDAFWFLASFVADHYQYHASMALIALAAAFGVWLAASGGPVGRRVGQVVAVCVLAVFAILTHQRSYAYKDDETLIRSNVAATPDSWAAHKNLGNWLSDHGQPEQAIEQYHEALRLFPMRAQLHTGIGKALAALGRLDEAVAEFKLALEGSLDDDQLYLTHVEVTRALKALQRPDEARLHAAAAMEAAVRLAPNDSQVRQNAGAVFLMAGQLDLAEEHLRQAIVLNPRDADSHNLLGELQLRRGDRPAAIAEFKAALAIDGNHTAAANNLNKIIQGYRSEALSPSGP